MSFSSQVIAVTEENQNRHLSYVVKEENLEEQCSLTCSRTLKKPRTTRPGTATAHSGLDHPSSFNETTPHRHAHWLI